jgi:hypothetical protein
MPHLAPPNARGPEIIGEGAEVMEAAVLAKDALAGDLCAATANRERVQINLWPLTSEYLHYAENQCVDYASQSPESASIGRQSAFDAIGVGLIVVGSGVVWWGVMEARRALQPRTAIDRRRWPNGDIKLMFDRRSKGSKPQVEETDRSPSGHLGVRRSLFGIKPHAAKNRAL